MKNKSRKLPFAGFILGAGAPIGWVVIRLTFFQTGKYGFWEKMASEIFESGERLLLYSYMWLGTSIVLSSLGFLFGKKGEELYERAEELDKLHTDIALQKELFESRYCILDKNIKNLNIISSKMQKSLNLEEILLLSAEVLHEVLEYERVNILMSVDGRFLRFVTTTGSEGFDLSSVTLPIDSRIGVIHKCFTEKRLILVDDIAHYPQDYHLQPPYDNLEPLRSRGFILCPIVVKGEAIGILAIDNKTSKRPLNDSDADTIMLFADQVASAILRINLLNSINNLTAEILNSFDFLKNTRETFSSNIMNLKASVESMADGTSIIATASKGSMASVEETSTAVHEISVAIELVTRNLDHLSGIVHQSASAMEEASQNICNVQHNAAISHEVSTQVKSQADKSIAIVSETIQSLAEIQNSVELSYEAIKRLEENSTRIENIVSVINNITKRTNLLALNASIIAAQAGEYGKSFGVVAEEIRNLSLQTGHSTGEIAGIINEIMVESKSAASNITATKSLVQRGVELGHSTGDTLKAIYNSSLCSLDMTQQIKKATEEQTAVVTIVAKTMEEISSMTSHIFSASDDQAKATRNIVRAIETIKEMSHEMVNSAMRQLEDSRQIRLSMDSVNEMVKQMFDKMEIRRSQSTDVIKDLESMKKQQSMETFL